MWRDFCWKKNVHYTLSRSRPQTKVPMERTHQGISTSDVWKSNWSWSRYNEVKRQLHIWPWSLEPSRSRSQTKVPMETTHQGLSTSDVWKSHWPWSRYNEVICQLHFDLETSNIQGQGHRQRSRWKQLIRVCLHLMCKRVIDHGLGTMKLNANNTFDLETCNIQGQGNRQRSRWKELIKVYLHLKCERVIDHGVGTMELNANYTFDLETWYLQDQGNRQRSRWKQLIGSIYILCVKELLTVV